MRHWQHCLYAVFGQQSEPGWIRTTFPIYPLWLTCPREARWNHILAEAIPIDMPTDNLTHPKKVMEYVGVRFQATDFLIQKRNSSSSEFVMWRVYWFNWSACWRLLYHAGEFQHILRKLQLKNNNSLSVVSPPLPSPAFPPFLAL